MTIEGWALLIVFVGILLALSKPVGLWLHALYEGRRTPLRAVLGPVERGFYRLAGVDPAAEQGWRGYATAMLAFNVMLLLLTYAILRLQGGCRSIRSAMPEPASILPSIPPSALPPIPTGKAMAASRRCRTCRKCWA